MVHCDITNRDYPILAFAPFLLIAANPSDRGAASAARPLQANDSYYHFSAKRSIILITEKPETGGEARHIMKKKTIRFLWISLLSLAALCVAVFTWITHVMVLKSDETLTQVANIYMVGINIPSKTHLVLAQDIVFFK